MSGTAKCSRIGLEHGLLARTAGREFAHGHEPFDGENDLADIAPVFQPQGMFRHDLLHESGEFGGTIVLIEIEIM